MNFEHYNHNKKSVIKTEKITWDHKMIQWITYSQCRTSKDSENTLCFPLIHAIGVISNGNSIIIIMQLIKYSFCRKE